MKQTFIIDSQEFEAEVTDQNQDRVSFILKDKQYHFSLKGFHAGKTIICDNSTQILHASTVTHFPSSPSIVQFENITVRVSEKNLLARKKSETFSDSGIVSPMPGKILKVMIQQGDLITKSQALIIVEAMKMEHTIRAPKKGVIDKLFCKEGDIVHAGFELLIIDDNHLSA